MSVTDEQAFSEAVSDPGRWRSSGGSIGSPGSDGPGSASRGLIYPISLLVQPDRQLRRSFYIKIL